MLADLASGGGNLLLDIEPAADGTIPVVMEERLTQIADWLKVNGEAIYGARPWKSTRQRSAGEVPKTEYNKEFEAVYDVMKLVDMPEPGTAGIEAFFTAKARDVYAILPHWPGRSFQITDMTGVQSIAMPGSTAPLGFRGADGNTSVELPELTEELMRLPAWVLKVSR